MQKRALQKSKSGMKRKLEFMDQAFSNRKQVKTNPEEDILSRYENCSDLNKLWIVKDQARKRSLNTYESSSDNLDTQLLKTLSNDLKYEIISFIPTYSKRGCLLEMENNIKINSKLSTIPMDELLKHVCDPLNPYELEKRRKKECIYLQDSEWVTNHKMRLIDREYAKRMKMKIINSPIIDLSTQSLMSWTEKSTQATSNCNYLLALLKAQADLSNNELDMTNPFIYSGLEIINSFHSVDSDSKKKSQAQEFLESSRAVVFNEDSEEEEQNEPKNIDTNMSLEEVDNKINEIIETQYSSEDESDDDSSVFSSDAEYSLFSQTISGFCPDKVITSYRHSIPFATSSLNCVNHANLKRVQLKHWEMAQYIGSNPLINSISLQSGVPEKIFSVLFKVCTNLKTINLYEFEEMLDAIPLEGEVLSHSLEYMNYYFPEITDLFEVATNMNRFLKAFPSLKMITFRACGEDLIDMAVESFDEIEPSATRNIIFNVDGQIHETNPEDTTRRTRRNVERTVTFRFMSVENTDFFVEQHKYFSCNTDQLVDTLFSTQYDIGDKKDIIDALCRDLMLPVEAFDHNILFKSSNDMRPIYEYLIYVANEYQNSRIHISCNRHSIETAVAGIIQAGWDYEKAQALDEISFIISEERLTNVLNRIREQYGNEEKFESLVRSILITHCKSFRGEVYLLSLLRYIAENSLNSNRILAPVPTLTYLPNTTTLSVVNVPLINLTCNEHTNGNHYRTQIEIVKMMTPSELLFQNENGDSCLHISCYFDKNQNVRVDNLVYDEMLKKQPLLPHLINKDNQNILHLICYVSRNIPLLFYLIENYQVDLYSEDRYGNTPFQLGLQRIPHFTKTLKK